MESDFRKTGENKPGVWSRGTFPPWCLNGGGENCIEGVRVGDQNLSTSKESNGLTGKERFLVFGLDKLIFCWAVTWSDWEGMISLLGEKTAKARALKCSQEIKLNDDLVGEVQPKGLHRCFCNINTEWGYLCISSHVVSPLENKGGVNVWVEAHAQSCWDLGIDRIRTYFAEWIRTLGGMIGNEYVSSVDLCADFYWPSGFPFEYLRERCVSRHDVLPVHVRKDGLVETFKVGDSASSAVFLRLYDKSRQYGNAIKGDKQFMWSVWGLPKGTDGVWRAEFGFRKEALREKFSVTTLDDLRENVFAMWDDATSKLISFREAKGRTEKNKERWEFSPFWQLVREPILEKECRAIGNIRPSGVGHEVERLREVYDRLASYVAHRELKEIWDLLTKDDAWLKLREKILMGGKPLGEFQDPYDEFFNLATSRKKQYEYRKKRREEWLDKNRHVPVQEWFDQGCPVDIADPDDENAIPF